MEAFFLQEVGNMKDGEALEGYKENKVDSPS